MLPVLMIAAILLSFSTAILVWAAGAGWLMALVAYSLTGISFILLTALGRAIAPRLRVPFVASQAEAQADLQALNVE